MIKCTKCHNFRDVTEFAKSAKNKMGHRSDCKSCNKIYRQSNSERISIYLKKYQEENREKNIKYCLEYRINNLETLREKDRNRCKDKRKVQSKKYYEANKSTINRKNKEYYINNKSKINKVRNTYNRKKRSIPLHKLKCNISRLILHGINAKGFKKESKTVEILGCSIEFFKEYLESKFEPWMNWENRALCNGEFNHGWDLDHIIPIKTAKTIEDVIRLNHYSNFQPLCSLFNRTVKKDKVWNY